ncbi:bifunctional diguanylate cyclase/phosphodiesterase [Loktanella salsilacus]|uniref:bifunctional diguanylate cyclase/phosphodiesterase n=1 Tax=Loktanella salsilacus TaxID=195913 RepID=UPI00356A70D3
MSMYTPRKMTLMSLLSVIIFLAVVGSGVAMFSSELDRRVVDDSTQLVSRYLNSQREMLSALSDDYNNWDVAYDNIRDGDMDSFYENYASGAEGGDVFTELHILNAFNHRSTSWTQGSADVPVYDDSYTAGLARTVRTMMAGRPIMPQTSFQFYTFDEGGFKLHAASYVMPTDPIRLRTLTTTDASVAIMTRVIDQDALTKMGRDLLLTQVTLSVAPVADRSYFAVLGPDGAVVAYVNWISAQPGSELVRWMLPWLLLVSLVFVAVSSAIAIVAHRNATMLLAREESANRAARTDSLTGIANRMAFNEGLKNQSTALRNSVALIYLDLNNFKKINDTFGHEVGDAVVIGVSARLSELSKNNTLVARMGGDEFSVVITNCADAKAEASAVLLQIEALLEQPLIINQNSFNLSAAIGVAINDNIVQEPSEMLRRADVAMYHAKRSSDQSAQFYDDGIDQTAKEDFLIERALRAAIEMPDELDILFQPMVSARTGQFVKAEALARWHSKTIGHVSPEIFITIAERSGLIGELGQILFEKICSRIVEYPDLHVSVNVSPIQLQDDAYLLDMNRIVAKYDIAPSRIEFELTEGIIVENRQLAAVRLKLMHDMGFKTSLDDFGTGFSSIGYLRHMPFDTLKIDRSFLLEGASEPKCLQLIKSMIIVGQSMGQNVVCEGIETEAQAKLVKSFGCDLFQGYLFDKPIPIEVLAQKYLKNYSHKVA